MRQPLSFYLEQHYPYTVTPDPDDGFVIVFPDLPGCITQVERASEIVTVADEIRELWLETAYAQGLDIPLPRADAAYSGKFVVRVPRSLHRRLAESAEREGVSLNQHVVSLLSMNEAERGVERRLEYLERKAEDIRVAV
jgi:antitoxin HicB